ncbi:MAG TPA: transferrin receptor-like dimerization domain-containing protein [Pyrinomonadaceae bacterium]|nr:transferrin receptor-like dimerization domain-containing protein [Pyrinomonadaceae bacterium]
MFSSAYRGVLSLVVLVSVLGQVVAQSGTPMLGFTTESATVERSAEARFDTYLKADNLSIWQKRLSARPHHLGSPYDKDNAEFIASQFRSWGYDTKIESFDVLFPTPKTRIVEMTSPTRFAMRLSEPPVKGDPTTTQQTEQLPTYNAYSTDGDVTGPLVYVNYGRPADYEELEKRGIDVKGKIVISRYGGSWRGIKPKVAAEHGAIGCIIYSDPRDDGFFQGDVYPKGAYRNDNGVQRGSVMDMPTFPGDPLTKGIGATKDAKRIDRKDATTLTKIPVLPVSYGDALPLLKNLDGDVVPDAWRGSLPLTYHFGGTTPTVHMKLEFNWNMRTINDVIAKMPGSERPDEWIIRGNHHDGWVNGAADPLSGQVAMMEEARGIAELAKTGWKPKRTIVYCAWDAEEEGLIGSTEWVETHADELAKKAAVYINTDSSGRGFLGVGGSHTLEKFINEVGQSVNDPHVQMTVLERARANDLVNGSPDARKDAKNRPDLRIDALGSGSDYTPFLQHLGISSMDVGFGGESGGGSYHSIYDSYSHFQRFIDPGNLYGLTLSKVCGHAVLRLANADTLPFEFTDFADTVGTYVKEVTQLADTMRDETQRMNTMLVNGTWKAVQDPTRSVVVPRPKDDVPPIEFKPLQDALKTLEDSARKYQEASKGRPAPPARQQALDEVLFKAERTLTRTEGLPRRDWFRHQIYAPGFYTGYGVKTLPAVREAIEQRNWKEAREQIAIVSATIEKFAAEIDRAAKMY